MEPTLSSVVRAILYANGNQPVRMNALWEAVSLRAPSLAKSKTHFKRRVMMGMFDREEVSNGKMLIG